jgi:branched-chain amino acid transport system ATP-binding protein
LLSGLLRPVAGQVVYAGRNTAGRRPEELVRLGVAHVPAGAGVVPELTVAENLGLAVLWRRDGSVRRDLAQVYEVFEPLARRRGDPGHRLSAGERQMLALARALVTNPRLLLVDEPSRGLPPRVVADVLALLRRLRESTGLTVLLAEQNVHGALSVADRGVVLVQGRIDRADASRLGSDDRRRHAYLGF